LKTTLVLLKIRYISKIIRCASLTSLTKNNLDPKVLWIGSNTIQRSES
jgi:hypothetical protein